MTDIPPARDWRIRLSLLLAFLTCAAIIVAAAVALGADPKSSPRAFQLFFYTTVTAIVLGWDNLDFALEQVETWPPAARPAVIPAAFAASLALCLAAMRLSGALLSATCRLLLPKVDPAAGFWLWPQLALTVVLVIVAASGVRHLLRR